jgi:PEP-CTERM motif
MHSNLKLALLAPALALCLCTSSAMADESALATIQLTSTTGPVSSPTYHYTITLHNTGTTPIGTFWYAWFDSPDYDLLPSQPTVVTMPSGWIAPTPSLGPPYDGYSIEWYNISGNAIAPGATQTFSFTTPDSPSVLGSGSSFYPLATQTSFLYQGFPETDAGYYFALPAPTTAPIPEPASLGLLAIGAAALMRRTRRPAR